eukprot:CAMPEP_0171964962 /NCGR_PEP_ID=MMETSP0993-20121228/184517_1 /TAXON_ID=483369 /ORGANISM="non described non described, Strain CCMP2098" /LENGTH=160 /DNA_ID=CAMNT_0012613929 /DNA_START=36 /DNA_END=515 /DNA_ORIENTATION=-
MAHHEIKRRSSNPGEFSADDSARKNTAIIDGVAGDFPPQPERAQIRTIDWDELYGINYLRHGTGTTLFSGFLCNASDETVGGGEGGKEAGGGGGGGGSGGGLVNPCSLKPALVSRQHPTAPQRPVVEAAVVARGAVGVEERAHQQSVLRGVTKLSFHTLR